MREQKERVVRGRGRKCKTEEMMREPHLWISLRIRYLKEVDGVSQGSLL